MITLKQNDPNMRVYVTITRDFEYNDDAYDFVQRVNQVWDEGQELKVAEPDYPVAYDDFGNEVKTAVMAIYHNLPNKALIPAIRLYRFLTKKGLLESKNQVLAWAEGK